MNPTLTALAAGYLDGSTDPSEATDRVLAAIDSGDGDLGAWQAVYPDWARRAAVAATETLAIGGRIGPFHGVPFALKDIIDVEGRITTAGCAAWADRVPATTATIGRRLLAAGGILVGKTKTVEFALGGWGTNQHMGTPRNPWDADVARVPGGSSSGSGVAVASGMVPCAIGTDTGGSVRLPAALCGIVGLKTTEGLLPTDGIVPLSHTLDTPGPMARTVADAALMFDTLTGRSPLAIDDDWRQDAGLYADLRGGVAGLRLGALPDGERGLVEADVLAAYDRSLDVLADLGADIRVFEPPLPFDDMKERTFSIVTPEAYYHLADLLEDPDSPMDEHVRARGLPGGAISAPQYIGALRARRLDQDEFIAALGNLDAFLTPSTPMVAPARQGVDESSTPAHFTRAGNYLGLCGLSLPNGLTTAGLPSSLQILARPRAEALALRIGAAYEEARGAMPEPPLAA
ncbi:MAG: amidase [Actinomycetia bacterium]|nr:amidase [Actinomycetes bacterium]